HAAAPRCRRIRRRRRRVGVDMGGDQDRRRGRAAVHLRFPASARCGRAAHAAWHRAPPAIPAGPPTAPDRGGRPRRHYRVELGPALTPVAWAVAAVLQAGFLRRAAPITTVAVGTWASVLLLGPLALAQADAPERWSTASALAFAYLVVVGTCFGMVVSLWLYRKLRPTTITLIQVVVPAEAILIHILALGESGL